MEREFLKGAKYFAATMARMGITDRCVERLTTRHISIGIWVVHIFTNNAIRMGGVETNLCNVIKGPPELCMYFGDNVKVRPDGRNPHVLSLRP